ASCPDSEPEISAATSPLRSFMRLATAAALTAPKRNAGPDGQAPDRDRAESICLSRRCPLDGIRTQAGRAGGHRLLAGGCVIDSCRVEASGVGDRLAGRRAAAAG